MEFLKKYWKMIAACAVIAAAAYVISVYFFQLMIVHGDSMYPALKNMQFAVINKQVKSYRAGDVVVFRSKGLDSVLVKRVAGCPGDSIVIRDGKLYVNGDESSLYRGTEIGYAGLLGSEITLKDGEYAVLGDNLSESKDSRSEEVGIIKSDDITGKVIM